MEDKILSMTIDTELVTAKQNNVEMEEDFDSYVGMFENKREEKEYDWNSDISIPEFTTQTLAESAADVNVYFSSRDFVEVYMQDESDEAIAKAAATKELLNRTLNQKDLYHYQKFVRARLINNLIGKCYAVGKWIKRTKQGVVGQESRYEASGLDFRGVPVEPGSEFEEFNEIQEDVIGDIVVEDRFDYDIIDPRNVFVDNKYTYSIQDKEWIYIRFEKTLDELKEDEKSMGYEGLDELGEPIVETETSRDTYNTRQRHTKQVKVLNPNYDVYDRYGKFWCKVTERDEEGNPLEVEHGIDSDGKPLKNAEFLETIITFAVGDHRKAIRFQLNKFKKPDGTPYKPVFRGICYVHPTDDGGLGDGAITGELQTAINDTFNISNDRVRLATIPVLTAPEGTYQDNSSLYIQPGHVMRETEKGDIGELKISSDINGAMQQMAVLMDKMQQARSTQQSIGQLPELASTSATAVAKASSSSSQRSKYKDLTFEHTFLTDLYQMVQWMTYQFAEPETGFKLMGERLYEFDPSANFFYKPVSQSIETEESKQSKLGIYERLMGYYLQAGQVEAANYIATKIHALLGDDVVNYGKNALNPEIQGGVQGVGGQGGQPTSNQAGLPQSALEQSVR